MTRLRTLPLCALFAGLAGPAASQVTLGVTVGWSSSMVSLTGIEILGEESRKGIAAGASATLPLSRSLGLRLEGSYVQRGATWSDGKLGDVSARVDYLQLAALGKVAMPLVGSRISLHLLAGPALGRGMSCEVKVEYALQPITLEGKCTDEETYNPTHAIDVGVVGGAGVQVGLAGRTALSLDFLYTHGLRSIYAGELERTVHNRAMTIQGGLVFPIG